METIKTITFYNDRECNNTYICTVSISDMFVVLRLKKLKKIIKQN
jgi:hypothetical protein